VTPHPDTPRPTEPADALTVLYDGGCPLCRREIAHVKGLAERQGDTALCFLDISGDAAAGAMPEAERAALLARFHVQRADGTRVDGAAAFVAMWARLPGWRWLARLARLPGAMTVLERAYRGFLRVRPALQGLARRAEAGAGVPDDAARARYLEQELRSDHAGETGAVWIYRGIAAVATRRVDTELLEFAHRHGDTEAEHLRLVELWLPPAKRSRLLGPWRLAGWLTGALPALAGRRAVYATIAAVETFVDQHYQQQIDHLQRHPGPEGLLPLLVQWSEESVTKTKGIDRARML
jgi:demethoxyubiquinone hydroxylase (CLK1/Coq7/Cat5 family)